MWIGGLPLDVLPATHSASLRGVRARRVRRCCAVASQRRSQGAALIVIFGWGGMDCIRRCWMHSESLDALLPPPGRLPPTHRHRQTPATRRAPTTSAATRTRPPHHPHPQSHAHIRPQSQPGGRRTVLHVLLVCLPICPLSMKQVVVQSTR